MLIVQLSGRAMVILCALPFSVESDSMGATITQLYLKVSVHNPKDSLSWKFKKADWELFKHLCFTELTDDLLHEADPVATFSDKLLNIAKQAIPMTTSTPKKVCNPGLTRSVGMP